MAVAINFFSSSSASSGQSNLKSKNDSRERERERGYTGRGQKLLLSDVKLLSPAKVGKMILPKKREKTGKELRDGKLKKRDLTQ